MMSSWLPGASISLIPQCYRSQWEGRSQKGMSSGARRLYWKNQEPTSLAQDGRKVPGSSLCHGGKGSLGHGELPAVTTHPDSRDLLCSLHMGKSPHIPQASASWTLLSCESC